jgi:excisionase family DNA binding protein
VKETHERSDFVDITGQIDLKDFQREYKQRQRQSELFEKREQKVIKPLDRSADYLSIKELAALLNVSEKKLYRSCAGGAFEGAIKLGRTWRIPVKKGAV